MSLLAEGTAVIRETALAERRCREQLREARPAGDPFDPATAERLYTYVYSGGGSRDFAEAYRLFRGRDPEVQPLLKGRGFAEAA